MGFLKNWKQKLDQAKKEREKKQRELEYLEKRRRRFPNIDFQPLPGCEQWQYSVVGESFHKKEIASIGTPNPDYKLDKAALYKKGLFEKMVYAYTFPSVRAVLEPEPTNKHDPNAIKVIANGVHVGYLSANQAAATKKMLESGEIRRIQCSIHGGDNRMIHTDGQHFEGKIPIKELRIDRELNDFSVVLFIDVEKQS